MSIHVDPTSQNIINHVAYVLDASSSMHPHRKTVASVIDAQIKHMAAQSTMLNQETRVSVWAFGNQSNIQCLLWDMDVLRVPSISTLYVPNGMTALIDGTMRAIQDLEEIPTKYGDHSFLVYVATDGEENDSWNYSATDLRLAIKSLHERYTMAALVPNTGGVHSAKQFGFPAGNIEIWDSTTQAGIEETGRRLADVTSQYMTGRAAGTRSTSTLFSMTKDTVNTKTVKAAGLKPLDPSEFEMVTIATAKPIRPFVQEDMQRDWVVGRGFYQLVKRESIQPQKMVAIVHKNNGKVYVGRNARDLLGLPLEEIRVSPQDNPTYDVFVQSTSVNRKLVTGQRFLYLNFQP